MYEKSKRQGIKKGKGPLSKYRDRKLSSKGQNCVNYIYRLTKDVPALFSLLQTIFVLLLATDLLQIKPLQKAEAWKDLRITFFPVIFLVF